MITTLDQVQMMDAALLRLERQVAPAPIYGDEEFYGYEPLPARVFLDGLVELGDPAERSFLDLGCGIGTKLALAYELGWRNLYGIEVDVSYAQAARRLVPEAQIQVADARTADLSVYDVVYMFQLARDAQMRAGLERSVIERMKSGAVAFFPHSSGDDFRVVD